MREWLRDVLFASALLAVVVLTIITYAEHRKPDPPAAVIEVIEVQDPELATALMLLGEWQMERQQWTYVIEQQAGLIGKFSDALVEEIKKGEGP